MSDDRIEGLAGLRRERAPERDLWPQIEARLKPRESRRWALAQLALAASLVAGLAASFTAALPPIGAPETDVAMDRVADAPSRAIVKANLGIVRQAERQLQAALQQNPESESLRALLASTQNRQRELSALL